MLQRKGRAAVAISVNLDLSDADLEVFAKRAHEVEAQIAQRDPEQIVAAARAVLKDIHAGQVPAFVAERLDTIESLIALEQDKGFELPPEDRNRVLAALAYFADADDLIPDATPAIGFLDDAIVIELCRNDLQYSLEAYDDFCSWRQQEAAARGLDPATLSVKRVDWADARAAETIARMRRRRSESYASGAWRPALFKVH